MRLDVCVACPVARLAAEAGRLPPQPLMQSRRQLGCRVSAIYRVQVAQSSQSSSKCMLVLVVAVRTAKDAEQPRASLAVPLALH